MSLADFSYDHPDRDVAAFKRSVANKLIYAVGKDPVAASPDDWLHATAMAVRDQLVERWMATTRAQYTQKLKRVYYLSMEFLIGRTFTNALLALELQDTVKEALADFGVDIQALAEREPDAALGNGGLGRLAACFLDSMATLGVPGMGYGIRYEYGMFRQRIVDGRAGRDTRLLAHARQPVGVPAPRGDLPRALRRPCPAPGRQGRFPRRGQVDRHA